MVSDMQREFDDEEHLRYLDSISAHETHAGYFSIDKKGKMTDSKLSDKKEKTSDDIDAYDLIMKNKELLLDRDPQAFSCSLYLLPLGAAGGLGQPQCVPDMHFEAEQQRSPQAAGSRTRLASVRQPRWRAHGC